MATRSPQHNSKPDRAPTPQPDAAKLANTLSVPVTPIMLKQALVKPDLMSPATMRRLQQMGGNQAVQRLLISPKPLADNESTQTSLRKAAEVAQRLSVGPAFLLPRQTEAHTPGCNCGACAPLQRHPEMHGRGC